MGSEPITGSGQFQAEVEDRTDKTEEHLFFKACATQTSFGPNRPSLLLKVDHLGTSGNGLRWTPLSIYIILQLWKQVQGFHMLTQGKSRVI